jgi:hypothetical protein
MSFLRKVMNVAPAQKVAWRVAESGSDVTLTFGNTAMTLTYRDALAFADIVRHHALAAKRYAGDKSKTIHIVNSLTDAAAYEDRFANIREV